MNIVHVVDLLDDKANGVATAVRKYVEYIGKYENVCIYNLNANIEVDGIKSYSYSEFNTIRSLPVPFNEPDVVVFNEVYKPKYLKLYRECLRNNIPYVIIPHGCLKIQAQNKKWLKKKVCNFLAFNKFIKKAILVQFLNEMEKEEAKFKYADYIVSSNGIDTNNSYKYECNNKGNLVYIGRYDVNTKGLDLLVEVCGENKEWFIENNVKVNLYGIGSKLEIEKLNSCIEKFDAGDIVFVGGPVYNEEKVKVLEEAYAFIQLSRHEGQPMGILEANAIGVPCIVTEGTTFAEYMNKNKCGIGVKFDKNDVFNAILKMYSSSEFHSECSHNSIVKAREIYSWDSITQILLKNYEEKIK